MEPRRQALRPLESIQRLGEISKNCACQANLENACIDSTVIRAHAGAAGAAKSDEVTAALGRSRGGFGCKIQAVTDTLGLPVRFILAGGQAADLAQAIPLVKRISTGVLLAEKGYDADALLNWLKKRSTTAVMPSKANRKVQRSCDWCLYMERHAVEFRFGKLQCYRRIPTRFVKKASHFKEMSDFAAALSWLRWYVNTAWLNSLAHIRPLQETSP